MSPDHADLELLSKMKSMRDGMIMLPPVPLQPMALQQAFYRALVDDWIMLVDMVYGQTAPEAAPQLMRVFKLTEAGNDRLGQLRVSVRI